MTFTFVFILNTESEFLMVSACCSLAVDDGEWLDTRLMTVSRCEKRFSFEKKSRKVEKLKGNLAFFLMPAISCFC